MTREEQIDWLCRLRADLNNGVIFTPWNKEFSEAINDVLEQEPTTKNDLGVDCISRQYLKNKMIQLGWKHPDITVTEFVEDLPSVTQEPQTFKWCTDCKEYDQEKHCCHRWTKVIRNTVEEMKQEYIEREVLDEIRAEIECLETYYDNDYFSGNKDAMFKCSEVFDVLGKYKAENNS